MPTMALVDANNFFVSAELAFRPELRGKPIVVLSSNDAVAIARSAEAKALGIKMASPIHEWRHLIQPNAVITFSANFSLYTDISERIRTILDEFTPVLTVSG